MPYLRTGTLQELARSFRGTVCVHSRIARLVSTGERPGRTVPEGPALFPSTVALVRLRTFSGVPRLQSGLSDQQGYQAHHVRTFAESSPLNGFGKVCRAATWTHRARFQRHAGTEIL